MDLNNSDYNEDEKGVEVFGPSEGPFEAPAKEFVPGPYYRDIEEREPEVVAEDEEAFVEESSRSIVDRRDLLKLFGSGAAMASASCVRRPEEKLIPYVDQPTDQVPGVPVYYASTCGECPAGCGVVVKTREGRPVKVEGNVQHPVSQGGLCSLGQSTLQGLYHPERRTRPLVKRGSRTDEATWREAFELLAREIKSPEKVGILTGGSTGHRKEFFEEFLAKIGGSRENLFTYESNSLYSSIAAAHEAVYGVALMPRLELKRSRLVVGIGSDFLDLGTSVVYHSKSFAESRDFRRHGAKISRLVQFESALSLTGSRADERHVIPPLGEFGIALGLIEALLDIDDAKGAKQFKVLGRKMLETNKALFEESLQAAGVSKEQLVELAKDLLENRSVVLLGGTSNADKNATKLQIAGILINELIGAYGTVLVVDRGWSRPVVERNGIQRFLDKSKDLEVLFVVDSDPAHSLPKSWGVTEALSKIPTLVSIQDRRCSTDELAKYILPGHHYLESWGDEQTVSGYYSVRQPAVRPISNSRQAEDIMLWVAASLGKKLSYKDYRDYLQAKWQKIRSDVGAKVDFNVFFSAVLRRGAVGRLKTHSLTTQTALNSEAITFSQPETEGLVLLAGLDPRLHEGRGASRPVLQEAGDSLTTIAWDTWVALSPATCKKLGVKRNDLVTLKTDAGELEVAVFPMPGLHDRSVYMSRGNGFKSGVSKITDGVGLDPLELIPKGTDELTGLPVTTGVVVELKKTGKRYALAAMQKHNDIANRSDIVKEYSFGQLKNASPQYLDSVPDLYPKLEVGDYRWGLSVDLAKCTGCSACMVACAQENNVPQVGREQILMGREMHWIRLDRYFSGAAENPQVTFQAVMCQQCNHAPCEAVCPVYATTHDAEGINSMTYNRCVGTRYCANACPYKVRRFNWYTHKWGIIGKKPTDRNIRALNPDVTVRTRGVMEKCNFCVQRLKEAKLDAKGQNRRVKDSQVKVACEQTCPSDAISFGNLGDPKSRVSQLRKDPRAYLMLNGDPQHGHFGLKTLPNVSYLAKVNRGEGAGSEDHG